MTGQATVAADLTSGSFTSDTWPLWGTTAELVVHGNGIANARRIAETVLATIDRTCSRFRQDSDLSRVNAHAGSWVRVDALFGDVLEAALWAAEVSDGLVDPTLGLVLVAWGYDRDINLLDTYPVDVLAVSTDTTDPDDVPAPDPASSWRGVGVRRDGDTVQVRVPPGVGLDLGAIGKAYATDAVAAALTADGVHGIVGIGGDVAVVGVPGTRQWRLDVREHPAGPVDQRLSIGQGAVCTSTTTHRRWRHQGRVAHHIIDPRTGAPAAQRWRAVTVAAASAVHANTASTAAIVLGDGAVPWLREAGLAARLVGADGRVTTTHDWPGQ